MRHETTFGHSLFRRHSERSLLAPRLANLAKRPRQEVTMSPSLRRVRVALLVSFVLTLVPAAVYAQASITGVVRDTSGAVLPGVTVEAESPALIERVRSGVTDGTGRFRIEELRPGAYTVIFTL